MPRPQKQRKVCLQPGYRGYRPIGVAMDNLPQVTLLIDEFESVRLLDFEHMNQLEASKVMGVSRPTLTRIYSRARKKLASALVQGHIIVIEGGNVSIDDKFIVCPRCSKRKEVEPSNNKHCKNCQSSK